MSLFGFKDDKYPTEWEKHTETLTHKVKRRKIKAKLETGETMIFEADHLEEDNYREKEIYRDVEDVKVIPRYSKPATEPILSGGNTEIDQDDIVAKQTEVVGEQTYRFEVEYKTREIKKESRSNWVSDTETEIKLIDVRQMDTE